MLAPKSKMLLFVIPFCVTVCISNDIFSDYSEIPIDYSGAPFERLHTLLLGPYKSMSAKLVGGGLTDDDKIPLRQELKVR